MLWWNRWKLRSTNPQRRQHAAVTLAARGDRTGTDAIVGMLQSDQGNVCWTIQAVTTARVQNPVVTRVLADLLKKTTDWVTAGNIVDALQAIGDRSPYIIDALVRAMSDPILSRVCGKAEDALKRLGAAEEAGMAARRRHLESLRNLTGAEIVLRLLSSIEGKGTSVPLPVTWAEELSLADEKFTEHSAPASEVSSVCKHLLGLPSSLFFGTP